MMMMMMMMGHSESTSTFSSGQLTRSSVSSLSLSQLSLASSSGWGSSESRKANCDLLTAFQNTNSNTNLSKTASVPSKTVLAPTSEACMEEEDWGFFVDTYDRFTTADPQEKY